MPLTPAAAEIANWDCYDEETLDIGAAAVGLTAAKLEQPDFIAAFLVGIGTYSSVFTTKRSATPAAATHAQFAPGQNMWLNRAEAIAFRAVREGANNGTIAVSYYRRR